MEYITDARKHVASELKGDVQVIRINTPGAKVSKEYNTTACNSFMQVNEEVSAELVEVGTLN